MFDDYSPMALSDQLGSDWEDRSSPCSHGGERPLSVLPGRASCSSVRLEEVNCLCVCLAASMEAFAACRARWRFSPEARPKSRYRRSVDTSAWREIWRRDVSLIPPRLNSCSLPRLIERHSYRILIFLSSSLTAVVVNVGNSLKLFLWSWRYLAVLADIGGTAMV